MKPPQLSEAEARKCLQHVLATHPCALLGVRGYYRDSMGEPGVNDTGIYDDAMFFVGPGVFRAVRANTDPVRLGWNAAVGKRFAMLRPGLWWCIRGPHRGKVPALRQATEEEALHHHIPNHGFVEVWRARNMPEVLNGAATLDEGYFAINIHKGGEHSTSSWGCQTIPPDVYDEFMWDVWQTTKNNKQDVIPYLLINGPLT